MSTHRDDQTPARKPYRSPAEPTVVADVASARNDFAALGGSDFGIYAYTSGPN